MIKATKFALYAAAGLLALGIAGAKADITVVSWGGAYSASQQKAYGDTWKGGNIHWENYNGGLGEVRAQVEAGNVAWDIVDVLPHEGRVGCDEGLFEELPRDKFIAAPDGTPMDEDIMVKVPNKCVVPQIFWSYMAFYDEKTFPNEKPTTIADFFDLEKFPGKRGIHTWPNALIEMALLADGVEVKDLYDVMSTDEGIDRAFAKLDTIKDDVVFWSAGAKPLELVKSGETSMALAYNGRVGAAILSEGESFVPIWDGQVIEEEWLVMVKGTKNYDEALDFLIHASAPEQQAGQAKWINYGPMRKSGLDIIAANEPWYNTGVNVMPHMPNREEVMARSVFANPDWWADNGAEVAERYTAWMAQ
ncbi:MAG TPA: extracellular solute-binding protein [Kiloniellales bacterium]